MNIVDVIKSNFLKLVVFNGFVATVSVIILLMIPNYYRSTAVLLPKSDSGQLGMQNRLGGLAALAGVNLAQGSSDKLIYALELADKREFINTFVSAHNYKIDLFALKSWDPLTNKQIYDDEIYSFSEKKWTRDVTPPKTIEPSEFEIFEIVNKNLTISQDKMSGIVSISFKSLI